MTPHNAAKCAKWGHILPVLRKGVPTCPRCGVEKPIRSNTRTFYEQRTIIG